MTNVIGLATRVIKNIRKKWEHEDLEEFRIRMTFLALIIFASSFTNAISEYFCKSGDYFHVLIACFPPLSGFSIFGLSILNHRLSKLIKDPKYKKFSNELLSRISLLKSSMWLHFAIIIFFAAIAVCKYQVYESFAWAVFVFDLFTIIYIFLTSYSYTIIKDRNLPTN